MRAWRSLPQAARWVAVLWLALIVLQRFKVPGLPVAVLLPVVGLWLGLAWYRGVIEVDRHRLLWWLATFGIAFVLLPVQSAVVDLPVISLTSIALVAVIWAAFIFRLKDRSIETYQHALRAVVNVTMALAFAAIAFLAAQAAGWMYRDVLGESVPVELLMPRGDYVVTYPLVYGSPLMRSNAWIGLEPSFISAQLGLGLLAALLTRRRPWVIVTLLVAMLCTVSGSGFAIAGVGAVILLLHPRRSVFGRYALAAVIGLIAIIVTPMGQIVTSRITESGQAQSSTSLRTILPYLQIWPTYIEDFKGVVFGRGPGSSQRFVDSMDINGLLVPTPIKIFFEYGLIAGIVLAALIIVCCLEGPSRSFAGGLFFSLFTLQAGLATPVITFPLLLFVTLWSPRADLPLERLRPQSRSSQAVDSLPSARVPLPRRRPVSDQAVS